MAILEKFRGSERGSTSVLFALSALPLIVLAGGAVDFTKTGSVFCSHPIRTRHSRFGSGAELG